MVSLVGKILSFEKVSFAYEFWKLYSSQKDSYARLEIKVELGESGRNKGER